MMTNYNYATNQEQKWYSEEEYNNKTKENLVINEKRVTPFTDFAMTIDYPSGCLVGYQKVILSFNGEDFKILMREEDIDRFLKHFIKEK